MSKSQRRVALVTGVGRRAGMGNAIAVRLAREGFDLAATYWPGLDQTTYGDQVLEEPAPLPRSSRRSARMRP